MLACQRYVLSVHQVNEVLDTNMGDFNDDSSMASSSVITEEPKTGDVREMHSYAKVCVNVCM